VPDSIKAVELPPMEVSEKLQGILATLPAKPGCYIYRNAEGTIIYIGKAINIKNRVRSYFHSGFEPR
jgi:excinuclease ABC subunit C